LIDASFADLQKGAAHLHFTDVVFIRKSSQGWKKSCNCFRSVVLLFAVPQFDFFTSSAQDCSFPHRISPPAGVHNSCPAVDNAEIVKVNRVPVSVSLIENAET